MTEHVLPLPILGSLLFTLMGPIAAIPLFAANTAGADAALRRRIALRAYLFALIGLAVAVFLGASAMAAWRVSPPALIIAAGLILTLMSLRTILGGGQDPRSGPVPAPTLANAFSPIAIPGLVTPMSVAILVIFVSFFPTMPDRLVILAVAAGIMTLNLGAMLAANWFMRVIGPAPLIVLGAVFGVLQAAMGVQMIVSGLALLPLKG